MNHHPSINRPVVIIHESPVRVQQVLNNLQLKGNVKPLTLYTPDGNRDCSVIEERDNDTLGRILQECDELNCIRLDAFRTATRWAPGNQETLGQFVFADDSEDDEYYADSFREYKIN